MSLDLQIEWGYVYSTASQIVNGLFPVYMVPLGITLGIGILGIIVKAFSSIVRGG